MVGGVKVKNMSIFKSNTNNDSSKSKHINNAYQDSKKPR